MAKFFVGSKPGIGPVVKVMANSSDDPLTTPNTDYAKFLFNSETGKLGYIYDTYVKQPVGGLNANRLPGYTYLIEGAGLSTAKQAIVTYAITFTTVYYNEFHLLNLTKKWGFNYPVIFEERQRSATGRFIKSVCSFSYSDGYDSGSYYYYGFLNFVHCGGCVQKMDNAAIGAYPAQAFYSAKNYRIPFQFYSQYGPNTARPGAKLGDTDDYWTVTDIFSQGTGKAILSAWDLPADETPLPIPGTPASGLNIVSINSTKAKIAMPGFDTNTATRQQLILDSDKVPAKIIKTGEIFVAANSSVVVSTPVDFPLTGNIYVDYMAWETSQPLFIPFYKQATSAWNNAQLLIEYEIQANSVTFYNTKSIGLNVRYMIVADDDIVPSSGTVKVLDSNTNFTRISRPGSDPTSPSWSDILLDTRLPYVPILADGYEDVSTFSTNATNVTFLGNKYKTVSFSNGGLKPFAKVFVKYPGNYFASPSILLSVSNQNTGFNTKLLKQSAFCELTDTSITFRCNPSAIGDFIFNTSIHNWQSSNSGIAPIGFRYYIFGVSV